MLATIMTRRRIATVIARPFTIMADKEPVPADEELGGIWFLGEEGLISLATSSVGTAIVLVPSEHVLMMAVDLPLPTRRQRISALPFAVEDQIADPLGEVHTALGEELSPRRHLAGAVRHSVMEQWSGSLIGAGLLHCALVPDALALPVPEEGSWSTQVAGDRVLVRTSDGAGFAAGTKQLPVLWNAAGNPVCISYGEPLPAEMSEVAAVIELEPLTARLMTPALDLRQGLYARPRRRVPLIARKMFTIVTVGALVHAIIAVIDTVALLKIADDRRTEAQVLVQRYLPGVAVDGDFAAEVNELLSSGGGQPRSRFFPLLARSSAALAQSGSEPRLRSLSYEGEAGELALFIEGEDISALQRAEGALAGAGLNPISGTALIDDGVAGARIVVRETTSRALP